MAELFYIGVVNHLSGEKAAGGCRTPRRFAPEWITSKRASVLECSSPLELCRVNQGVLMPKQTAIHP